MGGTHSFQFSSALKGFQELKKISKAMQSFAYSKYYTHKKVLMMV